MGESRKRCYLSVEQMTELYRVFTEKRYPDTWKNGYAERAHYSLGLFLAQYLCNGFYLADAGELTYSHFNAFSSKYYKYDPAQRVDSFILYEKKQFQTSPNSKWQRGKRIVEHLTEIFGQYNITLGGK